MSPLITESREWLMFIAEWIIVYILVLEYRYDKDKDDKKAQKRTKTSKKTTTQPGGATVTEENIEVVESAETPKEETK